MAKKYWEWTDEEADAELHSILLEHHADRCNNCGREIDRGDVAWNGGSTEAGTPWSVLQITCQNCDTQIIHIDSWYPGIDSFSEFVDVLRDKWEDG